MEEQLIVEKRCAETELESLLPENISFRKSDDMIKHFKEQYGIYLTSTDKEELRKINHPSAQNVIAALLLYRTINTQLSSLSRCISQIGNDDWFHDKINQLSSVTGRFSSVLHSVSKGAMRSLFKAKDGYQFIIADYSQQVARIISTLSGDVRSSDVLNRGRDIYMEVAMDIIGKPAEQCKECRSVAKTIVLGLNYGQSDYKIYETLNGIGFNMTLDDVQRFLLRYYGLFPKITAWRNHIVRKAREMDS